MIITKYEVFYRKMEENPFKPYSLLKEYNKGFERSKRYEEETYKNKLVRFKNIDEEEILENIFEILNIHHPIGYDKRSLSTGDVVVINNKAFYVDRFGFKDISNEFFK